MTKQQMKKCADAFCVGACGRDKMFECDCFQTSCYELAEYLLKMRDLDKTDKSYQTYEFDESE
jgi:hypothetical protein